jgi:adenosylcobyric acid synthase
MGGRGTLLVAGTGSNAGKTTLVAGLCRLLRRQGVTVAPFKAQNMSLNSYVTSGGAEIARAQALQAQAAGAEPEAAMNPVLLKPGSETRSHLIVLGSPAGEVAAGAYLRDRRSLLPVVTGAYARLRERFDVVICEGAGSPAEINLRAGDLANLGFAQAVQAPVVLVGDIDRGGVFASLAGTVALLSAADQRLVQGFVINRFRGDRPLLEPGLASLRELTGRPTLGVIPYLPWLRLDAEDALALPGWPGPAPPAGADVLRIAVIALPHASNLTDIDPLAAEPGVIVHLVTRPEELADADLAVLPGTRATVADLRWLRGRGLATALRTRAAAGQPILGICGGYQMLGEHIDDQIESGAGQVPGLGVLPVRTQFHAGKVLARPTHQLPSGNVEGYQIYHGLVQSAGGEPFFADEGCRSGTAAGTTWHGLFENDAFRRGYLTQVAAQAGRRYIPCPDTCFAAIRDRQLNALADTLAEHLDMAAIEQIITGPPMPRPALALRLARRPATSPTTRPGG